jgi:hypothetical protein
MKTVGMVIPDDLIVEIRELEKKLSWTFKRKLVHLMGLTFNDGFVVLLTKVLKTDFDDDSIFQSWTRGSNKMRMWTGVSYMQVKSIFLLKSSLSF